MSDLEKEAEEFYLHHSLHKQDVKNLAKKFQQIWDKAIEDAALTAEQVQYFHPRTDDEIKVRSAIIEAIHNMKDGE